jgi:hypothetical protein
MQELDFISAEGVISLVQEDLSSFDANNQLDPGRWYPWIRKVVSDLGIACLEYKHALLWVKNYKVEIPCDFYILDSAFLVNQSCCGPDKGIIHYQGRKIIWDDTTTSCAVPGKECNNSCEYLTCELDKFNEVTVREYVMGLPYTYTLPTMFPLYVNQRVSKGWCLPKSICFGSTSKHEITITNGEMYTNFDEGLVLFNYYAYPVDENNLPKIPDHPKYKMAIEYFLKWKTLEKLWINNDDMGVAQKMTYFKDQFENNYYPDAEYFSKLQSMSATTDMIRNNRRRFQIFQLTQR